MERVIKGYTIKHTLGSGLQGKVKLGVRPDGAFVALKLVDKTKIGDRELCNLLKEIESMRRVSHPRVLRLLDLHNDAEYPKKDGSTKPVVLIVLELAVGGELFDFMMYTGNFPEPIARAYFQQLIEGVSVCHQNGIFHRDIKPENLLLDEQFLLKIADFGLSAIHEGDDGGLHLLQTQCGTRGYMSPEILSAQPYDGAKADIWSCGVVLFIMLAGFPPFQIADKQDWWFRAVLTKQYDAFWAAHSRTSSFSPGAMSLLNQIFVADPNERVSLKGIMAHEWFQESNITHEQLCMDLQRRKEAVDVGKMRKKEMEMQQNMSKKQMKMQGSAEFNPFERNVMRSVGTISDEKKLVDATERLNIKDSTAPILSDTVTCYTCFYSDENQQTLLERTLQALGALSAKHKVNQKSTKVKANINTPVGQVDFVVSFFRLSEKNSKHFVKVRRRNGSLLKFQEIYKMLCNQLEDIICPPPVDRKSQTPIASRAGEPTKEREDDYEELLSDETQMI